MLIDLDRDKSLDKSKLEMPIDIKIGNRIVVKNSVLENIDTIDLEILEYILANFKDFIKPVATSLYYPSREVMSTISKCVPEMKVQFKTGNPGSTPIIPISSYEFFEGLEIFDRILAGLKDEWSDLQKYKYLYNELGKTLTYNLNVYEHTTYANKIEKLSRNIFTGIVRGSAICSSFAASYDYLCYRANLESDILHEEEHDYVLITADGVDYFVDPTFDAAFIKFGLQTRNFAISKEDFIKNDHNLEEAEAESYEVGHLSKDELKGLDLAIGYLDSFGGVYQDDRIIEIAKHLEGESNVEKAMNLFSQISSIPKCGFVGHADYEKILGAILSFVEDENFIQNFEFVSLLEKDDEEMNRILVISIRENGVLNRYVVSDDLTSFTEFDEYKKKQI